MSLTVIAAGQPLHLNGRVAWRQGETLGVCFSKRTAEQGHRVSSFTRALLEDLA